MAQELNYLDLATLPKAVRGAQWHAGLASWGITSASEEMTAPTGTLEAMALPSGLRVGRIIGPAQDIRPIEWGGPRHSSLLVVLTLRSRGMVCVGDHVQYFAQNDLTVFDQSNDWCLRWTSDVKAILLEVPLDSVSARLGRQRPRLPLVLGTSIMADMARSMLAVLGTQLDTLTLEDLAASESTLLDTVCSAVMREAALGGDLMTPVQVAHYRRVAAAIDTGLMSSELSLTDVANTAGLSARYVQRLFELRDDNFSRYVRQKRLDRSRADLLDVSQNAVSIAQIAHRWGFASPAHFSRSFRSAFSISPRDLRDQNRQAPLAYAYRGAPGEVTEPSQPTPAQRPSRSPIEAIPGLPNPAPSVDDTADFVLPVRADTVHWGYISRTIPPVLYAPSGSVIRVETLTQHGGDDYARFIEGDPGAESVFRWTRDAKAVDRRGAGPMDASIFGRGAGEGFGVHICTGPIHVTGAEPGDILEVEILGISPRPSSNPRFKGKAFGSNVSAWWGYQYGDPLQGTKRHETVTIFEVDLKQPTQARALYQYNWTAQTDPFGVVHEIMDYPGVPVDHDTVEHHTSLEGIVIPARPHFGFIGVAPREAEIVDSIPPGYFGGNIDNWRAGPGARIYLPVSVEGALLSIGDGHFSQGDGEINGTGLEMSLTGTIRITLHKAADDTIPQLRGLSTPLIETPEEWVIQSFSFENHLRDLGRTAQTDVYTRSSVDHALRNAYHQARRFLMDVYNLTEDDANVLLSVAVDFSVTQVADGNFGVHATIRRSLFNPATPPSCAT